MLATDDTIQAIRYGSALRTVRNEYEALEALPGVSVRAIRSVRSVCGRPRLPITAPSWPTTHLLLQEVNNRIMRTAARRQHQGMHRLVEMGGWALQGIGAQF